VIVTILLQIYYKIVNFLAYTVVIGQSLQRSWR